MMPKTKPTRFLMLVLVVSLLPIAAVWGIRVVGDFKLAAARDRFESQVGSLELGDYLLPELDEANNAAVWLRAGAEQLEISSDGKRVMAAVLDQSPEIWSEETMAEAEALVEANERAFDVLRRCIGLEESSFGVQYEKGISAMTPPMLELYRTGVLIAVDLRLALGSGELERVAQDLEILDQLSQSLARESFLVSVLMHLAVERLFVGAVRDVVEAGLEDRSVLSTLQKALVDRDSAGALRRGISAEAAAVLGAAGVHGTEMGSTGRGERLYLWMVEPVQLAALLDTYRELVGSIDQSWAEIHARSQIRGAETAWGFHSTMLPNLIDSVDKLKAIELSQRLATEALALHLQRLESGALPSALADDISDPYANGSVIYELSSSGSARLVAPEAVAMWLSEHAGRRDRQQPVFEWQLSDSDI